MNSPNALSMTFQGIWIRAIARVWYHRSRLVVATLGFWIPWNLVFAGYDPTFEPFAAFGMTLSDLLAIAVEPIYAALVLVIIASPDEPQWDTITSRSLWLVPRLWLITIKVTALAIVVPYAALHIGSAVILTWWETYAAAKMIVALTAVSFVWVPFVYFAYVLTAPVLIAQTASERWAAATGDASSSAEEKYGISTGWALRTSRRLVRGFIGQTVFVAVTGQAFVSLVTVIIPPNAGLITVVAESLAALSYAVWWALLWELLITCVSRDESHDTARVTPV